MKIPQEEMIDVQDIIREKNLADILISGDDCIHYIIEMFDDQPAMRIPATTRPDIAMI